MNHSHSIVFAIALAIQASQASAAPTIPEGSYRVDWNNKVRDLCVDYFTNEDLNARDWQAVMAAQGALCKVQDVRVTKNESSWTGRCNQPGAGRVLHINHRVTVKIHPNGSFDLLTVMTGDQQAVIPIRGDRLKDLDGQCMKFHELLRLWQ